jgi:hypothetical protein
MSAENYPRAGLKQKAIHEFEEFAEIFLYLAFSFCALATYSMLLLHEFHISHINYGFALINALVIAKVILIGEYVHLGRKQEAKALLLSAVYKAFLFGLLVFGFHLVEEVVKRILHGESMAITSHEIRIDYLLSHSVIVFSIFIPLFAFRELRRVLGEDKFHGLFLRAGEVGKSELPTGG